MQGPAFQFKSAALHLQRANSISIWSGMGKKINTETITDLVR